MNITTYTHQGISLFIWFLLVVLQKQITSAKTLVFVVVVVVVDFGGLEWDFCFLLFFIYIGFNL